MKWRDEIIAMANDEVVEYEIGPTTAWSPASSTINPITHPTYRWRIRPRTIMLNGEELPAPVKCTELVRGALLIENEKFYFETPEQAAKVHAAIVRALTS